MKKKKKEKGTGLWHDFKAFITRGNVIDLAVGVVIGGAFGAIVTAVVSILISVCTWAIPGGIAGLVTVLPAASAGQVSPLGEAMNILTAQQWLDLTTPAQQALYVKHGANYYFSGMALIDWGALINAVISFLIIAIVLFTIVKIVTYLGKKRKAFEEKAKEEYYKKHPEERPLPPEPGKPVVDPTIQLLTEIRDELKAKKK